MEKIILILGAGGHAKVVADCALASGEWQKVAFLDDRYPDLKQIGNWPVIGKVSDIELFVNQYSHMALGVGANHEDLRLQWLKRGINAGAKFPVVIHAKSIVSPYANIGDGTVVLAGAIVNVDAKVGKASILNTSCSIDHDCVIGDGSHISPRAALAGGVIVGEKSWIGMGANVIQGVKIGSNVIVGAGSLVLKNIDSGSKVVGVPARSIN